MRIIDRPHWLIRIAMKRLGKDRRGGWAMLRLARSLGLLADRAGPFDLPVAGDSVVVPYSWLGTYVARNFKDYEPDGIAFLASAITAMPRPVLFIDGGADVGVFSRLLLQQTSNIARIVAFEPNRASAELLRINLAGANVPTEVFVEGLSDQTGFASLIADEHGNGHDGYLSSATFGIPLRRIDQLDSATDACVAIKLDIEGSELAALRGGAGMIGAAEHLAVQFEAHRDVMSRTGIDPIECARFLATIRPFRFTLFDERSRTRIEGIDLSRPLFAQFPEFKILDVIAVAVS